LVLSSLFAVSLGTVNAEKTNIVLNGDFLTGNLTGWTLEYAAAGGIESLDYNPSVSSGGHNGSNFVHSTYCNYAYSSFTIVQKLPALSSSNKNASCWTGWSFGGYFKVNYTDGSFDMVDIPERLSMSPWTQVELPLTADKTLDCVIIHGCGSGGHNGGLTVSDVQILSSTSNVHPPKDQFAQLWLHQRFFLPLAVSWFSLITRYVF
jgi:hypothetical protein